MIIFPIENCLFFCGIMLSFTCQFDLGKRDEVSIIKILYEIPKELIK